jgi:hypothetical protein
MENKEQLVKTIREWVKIDNELRVLQQQQALRKKEKKNISTLLMEVMKKNEIECFDINDGQLIYNKKSIKKPITKKMLLNVLSTFFQDDTEKATELNNYILENREDVVKENIVRKLNK